MVKLNLSGVSFSVIEANTEVDAVLMDHKISMESKASGQPTASVQFTITAPEEYKGRKLFRNFSFQPDSLPYFKRFLIAMGVEPDVLETDFDVDDVLDSLHGDPCTIVVGVQEYQGENQNTVRTIKPASAF